MQKLDKLLQNIFRPNGRNPNRPIRLIPNPTLQTQPLSFHSGMLPKKNTLNPAVNRRLYLFHNSA
jgi:hypothetical protein